MSYQVLARKYRPQKFSEVIGQDHVTRTLKNAIEQQRTAHGYIFSGHRGIGKTTVARILAMALNCRSSDKPVSEPCGICESCTEIRAGNSVDVIEIDAATNRGIDEIRELREATRISAGPRSLQDLHSRRGPSDYRCRVQCSSENTRGAPGHVVFMLATTQPEDIPQTIRSRCQHFSFRAVRFEEILGQLKDLVAREHLEADEDALALVAEGGDGSIRDALSILDQAIASSSGRLSLDEVRQLVGAAPSGVLEQIMQSVAQSSSEEVLRVVDQLISEGHSPTHFARQMVRFLRNTVVAKIAGSDSSLLQISGDERKRVARVAELFSEEDLARHLQIMLRTHSELGYRQEQRFHLELGLLKMAHAQRLLPIEQLLSEAGVGNLPRPAIKPSIVPDARKSEVSPAVPPNYVSPFAADSARKGGSKPELSTENSLPAPSKVTARSVNPPVVMGSAAPAAMSEPMEEISAEVDPDRESRPAEDFDLSRAVLDALAGAGHRVLVSMLDGGEWKVQGDELQIKVTASAAVVDMSLSAEAKRLLTATATQVLGRPVKLKIIPGSKVPPAPANRGASNGGGRSRVEQDPVVRRMQEKFGAEIRTVIDYKERR